jgi:hypothetical protein
MADITLQIRRVIIVCCILYNATWPEIESMTGVKQDKARHLIAKLII